VNTPLVQITEEEEMATAEEVRDEPVMSAPSKSVTFSARREDLRLVRVARYPVMGAAGQKVDETKGEVVCFRNGRLEVPLEGDFTLEDGRTAPAVEILGWLEKHRLNGDAWEGFFRVEFAAPPPTQDEMQALVDAAMELNVDKLREIIRQEEEGWAREPILRVARGGVEKIEAALAAHAEQADEPEPAKPTRRKAGDA
jgi:hypothetical protein